MLCSTRTREARGRRPGLARTRRVGALLAVACLGPPGVAQAATKPAVTTGGAANITPTSVRLTGTVDPNGAATEYQFQYGPTTAYGQVTPPLQVTGDGVKTITVDVEGLAPATRYYYRLVARNSAGETVGARRSFRTLRQPLGIELAASPNPVVYGGGATIAGRVTGTGAGGRTVVLQSNPFPFTQGFQNAGNAQIADAQGNFAFPLLFVPFNAQYRVVLLDRPNVASPIVTLNVAVRVNARVGTNRVRKGSLLTFQGTIQPAIGGSLLSVQRKDSKGRWVKVGGMAARHSNSKQSKFKRRVRIRRTGTYRVYATVANGQYAEAASREFRIRVK